MGRFLPPKNRIALGRCHSPAHSMLWSIRAVWRLEREKANATAPATVAPNTAPIKAEDGWKERSCGKAGFVARNNLDGDGDSWFNIFSSVSGVQMALPVVKKVPAEAVAESRVVMAEWNLPK